MGEGQGRYRILEPIGDGASSVVFRAEDTERPGRQVALKTASPRGAHPDTHRAFREEFRRLSRLRHPGLPRVLDFDAHGPDGAPALVLELVEGRDLARAAPDLEPAQLFDLLRQALGTLAYLHARGLLHLDLKPENLMVREGSPPALKLLDLGLSGLAIDGRSRPRGTPAFMAPEVRAGGPWDQRADLWSLGATFQAVLGAAGPDERPWSAVLPRLLDRQPERRFPDARAALRAVQAALGGATPLLEGPEEILGYLESVPLVGRDAELRALAHRLRARTESEGVTSALIVEGKAGTGKSRLLQEFALEARADGARLLTAPAPPGEGPPFYPLRRLAAALGAEARELRFPGEAGRPLSPRDDLLRFHEELFALLLEAARRAPVVVHFEDLHLHDRGSLQFASFLVRTLAAAARETRLDPPRLVPVLSYRGEAEGALPPRLHDVLRDAAAAGNPRILTLHDFTPEETRAYLRGALAARDVPPTLVEAALSRTGGNPRFLAELLRTLAGELRPAQIGLGLALDPQALLRADLPATAAQATRRRIDALGEEDRRILRAAALARRPMLETTLERALGVAPGTARRLDAAGLLLAGESDGQVRLAPADPMLREVALRALNPEEAHDLHMRLGGALEAEGLPGSRAEAAHHYLRCRHAERAVPLALEAAEEARAAHAPEEAEVLLKGALRMPGGLAPAARARALLALGELLRLRGETGKAVRCFRALHRNNPSPETVPPEEALLHVAEAEMERSDGRAARHALLEARRVAGRAGRPRLLGLLAAVEGRRGRLERGIRLARLALRAPGDGTEARSDWATLARLLYEKGDCAGAAAAARRQAALCRKAKDRSGLAGAVNLLGHVRHKAGDLALAERCYRRALKLRTVLHDLPGQADLHNNLGMVHRARGEAAAAVEELRRCLSIKDRMGDRRGIAASLNNLGNVYFDAAKLDRAEENYRRSLRLYETLDDPGGLARIRNNLGGVARLRGRPLEAAGHFIAACRLRRRIGAAAGRAESLGNLGFLHLELNHVRRAELLFRRLRRLARETGSRSDEAAALRGLGLVRGARREVGAAEELLREAAGLFRDLGRPRSQAETLVDLAKLRLQRRDLAAGHEYLAEAQAVFRAPRANEVSATALLLEAQMRLYARDADQRRFQGALGKALRAAEEAGNKDLELQAYSLGGLAGLRFGDLDESYAQLSRAAETLEERASSLRSPARRGRFLQGHDPRLVARALARLTRRLARAGAGVAPLPETAALRLSLHEAGRHLEMTRRRFDKQNAGLKRILAIGNALNSTRDPARLFDLILDSILDLTRAERGFLLLTRPEGDFEVKAARTRGEDVSGDPRSEIAFGPVARVIRERKPLLLKDAAAAAGEGTRSVFRLDLRSILCVPLFHRERVLGALYVDNRTQAGQFDADDLELLTIFGSQAAVALENARLVTDLENSLRDLKDTQDLLIRNEKLRVVGEMASGVFHDLNNLLTAVVGRTQLLMTDAGLRRHADELQVIEKAALDGAEIIQGFQNFTRPGQEVRFEPVRLSEVVEDALNLSRTKWRDQPQREGREVHVVRRVADPLYVLGNPRELREVLVNLIFNAVDALPRGGTITLEAEGAGEVALVRVRDDGVGMTQEVRRRLFDPFFTTKGPKGTGLGMSICYSILQRHKGSISVESTPGQGTVISLTLLRATGATAPAHAGSDTGGVLVIDDEESILNLLQSAFTAAGLRVCTSKSGKEGLARFKNGNFGFVITDFKMPGLSGLDVAREVKRLAPSVPVALVTAWPVEGSDAGDPPRYVDRVVHKPFRVHELIEMVGESLSARAG